MFCENIISFVYTAHQTIHTPVGETVHLREEGQVLVPGIWEHGHIRKQGLHTIEFQQVMKN